MHKLITVLLCCFLLINLDLAAQHKGSYDTSITYMSEPRTLSFHVPKDYDKTKKYKLMICLHGMGDNSINYRNALINTLNWDANFEQTIFVCPDGGSDPNKDFHVPEGDIDILKEVLLVAEKAYSIDMDYVVLQGFSLGGRSATKFGLDNPTLFKGLILSTPAFQGRQDAENRGLATLDYDFDQAADLPIYLTVGQGDLYYNIINPLIPRIKKLNGMVYYDAVEGMGHTVLSGQDMASAYPFFDQPAIDDLDVDLFEVEVPAHSCDENLSAICYIQNRSNKTVTSADIEYEIIGGEKSTFTWTGTLAPYEHQPVNPPSLKGSHGKLTFVATLGPLNTDKNDVNSDNNSLESELIIDLVAEEGHQSEGFEDGHDDWTIHHPHRLFAWAKDTDVKKSGEASLTTFGTILLFNTAGNIESFESPVLNFSSVEKAQISFDLAFAYHQYTPPYFTENTIFADTLDISISTDCGETWESVYYKGGAELQTTKSPIINPLSLNDVFVQPTEEEWRREYIDLSAFKDKKEAIVRFNYISGLGGSINIDNIDINSQDVSVGLNDQYNNAIQLYPNPAAQHVTIESAFALKQIQLYDLNNRLHYSITFSDNSVLSKSVDLSQLPAGIYSVKIQTAEGMEIKKLIIN